MQAHKVDPLALTPREREVAELITRGYSNPQIAVALVLSRETVKSHVSNILSKLGVASRGEVWEGLDRQDEMK